MSDELILPGGDEPKVEDTQVKDETPEQEDDGPLVITSLIRKKEAVSVTMPDGSIQEWFIYEMNGIQKTTYQEKQSLCIEWKNGQPHGIKYDRTLEIDLICMCVRVPKHNSKGELEMVPPRVDEVSSWPGPVVEKLARRCERLNGINKGTTDNDKRARKEAKKN